MDQVENSQKGGTEASVSFSTLCQRRRPMLHYVSDANGQDPHDISLSWPRGWLSGWFIGPGRKDAQQTGRRSEEVTSMRRRGIRQRAMLTPRSRTTPSFDAEEAIYVREDFLRLQAECINLKHKHEKLLERAHAADLEMEMYVLNVVRLLERNNAALRDTTEQLRSSEERIAELKELIAAKDMEIERLRHAANDAQSDDDTSSPSVHYCTTPSSKDCQVLLDVTDCDH